LADEFRKGVEGQVKVTYHGGLTQGDKDFSAVLTNVKTGNPDLIYFGGIYPEGGLLVKQSRALGIKAPLMSGDGVIGDEFLNIAGADAEGTCDLFPDVNNTFSNKFVRTTKTWQARPLLGLCLCGATSFEGSRMPIALSGKISGPSKIKYDEPWEP
jgi:ABC-type branched-subunit amino acid transport system substrate-binding protein